LGDYDDFQIEDNFKCFTCLV